MENLHLNYYCRIIDSTQREMTSETKQIVSHKYSVDHINKDFLDGLYAVILRTKGDWVDFELSIFNKNYYLDIYLVYHKGSTTGYEEQNNRLVEICDKYLKQKGADKIKKGYNNADVLSQILENKGFIINIVEEDGSGLLYYNEVNDIFEANNIDYKILSVNDFQRECGASMGSQEILYFIATAAVSGITWDVIKNIFNVEIKPKAEELKLHIFDNFSFKRMRKAIAERIREKEKNIILYKMIKDGDKIKLLFRSGNKRINIETDNSYNIISFKMKDE